MPGADDSDDEGVVTAPVLTEVRSNHTLLPRVNDERVDQLVTNRVAAAARRCRGDVPPPAAELKAWVSDVTVGDDAGEYAIPKPVPRQMYDRHMTGMDASTLIDHGLATDEDVVEVAKHTVCILHGALESGHRVAIRVDGYQPHVTLLQRTPGCSIYDIECAIRDLTGLATASFSVRVSTAKKSYGWHPSADDAYAVQEYRCVEVMLPTLEAFHKVSRKIGYRLKNAYEVVERRVDDTLRFFDRLDLPPCSWIRVDQGRFREDPLRYTYADVEYSAHISAVAKHTCDAVPPVQICSFDCEMLRYSLDSALPQADEPKDIVAVISVSLNRHGAPQSDRRNFVFSIGPDAPARAPATTIYRFQTEKARINALRDLLVASGTLVLTGYNILNFDLPYLDARAKLLKCERFWGFGGFVTRCAHIKSRSLASSALGQMETNTVVIQGVLVVDMLEEVKRRFQLASYKLKDVTREFLQAGPKAQLVHTSPPDSSDAQQRALVKVYDEDRRDVCRFLQEHGLAPPADDTVALDAVEISARIEIGDFVCLETCGDHVKLVESMQKIDLPIPRLFRILRTVVDANPGCDLTPMAEVDEYADCDALLPLELFACLHVLVSLSEVARVTSCRISEQLTRGQGIKAFSAYVWFLHRTQPTRYVYTGCFADADDINFTGATVLDPVPGYYCDPIITLDFASLYPSIMRTWNICPSTLDVNNEAESRGVPCYKFHIEPLGLRWQPVQLEPLGMRWKRVSPKEEGALSNVGHNEHVTSALQSKWAAGACNGADDVVLTERELEGLLRVVGGAIDATAVYSAGVCDGISGWFRPAQPVVENVENEHITYTLLTKRMASTSDDGAGDVVLTRQELEDLLRVAGGAVDASTVCSGGVHGGKRTYFRPAEPVVDTFVKAETCAGVFPRLLKTILDGRKRVKRLMAQTTDSVLKAVYNQRQLALKVLANSLYGATGAKGYLTCPQIARSVCFNGRYLIDDTKKQVLAHESCGRVHAEVTVRRGGGGVHLDLRPQERCRIIYGDSVASDTPVLIRYHTSSRVAVTSFDVLAKEVDWAVQPDGKEAARIDADVWSDKGWTPIRAILRHKVGKRLFRVCAEGGTVVCTSDHSLLTKNGAVLKPESCTPRDTELCTAWPKSLWLTSADHGGVLSDESALLKDGRFARLLGMFLGAGKIQRPAGGVPQWALKGTVDAAALAEYKRTCERMYPECTFTLMDTLPSHHSAHRLLVARSAHKDGLHRLAHDFSRFGFDALMRPHVPEALYYAPGGVREEYLRGVCDARGSSLPNGSVSLSFSHAVTAQGLYALLRSLSRTVTISPTALGYTLVYSRGIPSAPAGRVHAVLPRGSTEDFVYDLTTDSGHFGAGVGELVVHNTDSVMVLAPGRSVQQAWDLGEILAHYITEYFPGVIELECEQIKCPAVFRPAKKNYIACVWEPNKRGVLVRSDDILAKGNEIARRDHPPYVRESLKRALRALMFGGCELEVASDVHAAVFEDSLEKCLNSVRADIDRLVQDLVPIDEFCLSKTLKRKEDYKNPFLPHYQVALRLPQWPTNARVRFFMRQPLLTELHHSKMDKTREIKLSELAEDPDTAAERKVKPWRHKALSSFRDSLKRPLVGGWPDDAIRPILVLFDRASVDIEHQLKRQRTLMSFFQHPPSAPRPEASSGAASDSLSKFAPLPPRQSRAGRGGGVGASGVKRKR